MLAAAQDRRAGPLPLFVLGAELFFGAMEADAEVVALDAELAADFIFLLFFQEDSLEDGSVAASHRTEDFPHNKDQFFRGEDMVQIDNLVRNLIVRLF